MSVLGGGKFENGAITGSFGYLFNNWQHTDGIGNSIGATDLYYRDGYVPVAYIGALQPANVDIIRLPDYYTLQFDGYIVSLQVSVTSYGDISFYKGVSRPYMNPVSYGVSISASWIQNSDSNGYRCMASRSQVKSFVNSPSVSIGGYKYIGGTRNFGANETSNSIGLGYGGISLGTAF